MVELLMRLELTTSSLPRKCSTPELQRLLITQTNSDRGNPRQLKASLFYPERKTGLEPATYSLEGYRSTK